MATDWNGVKIKCPFLAAAEHTDRGGDIACEGVTPASKLHWEFDRKADYDIQLNVFCYGKYKNCEVYRMKCGIYGYED